MLQVLAVDGASVDTFGEVAEVFAIDYLAAKVIDDGSGFAWSANGEFHGCVVDSGVGIEADAVVADGVDCRDVKIDVLGNNLVFVVDDIGAIHEYSTAVGAKVHGFAPLGAGEDVEFFRDTFVTDVLEHGVVASNLVHGGDGNATEIAVFRP